MKRRAAFRLALAATALLARADRARAEGGGLSIIAGGPPDSAMDRWARALCLGMNGGPGFDVACAPFGGLDGVTAANRLDALVVPDGATAALLPGASLIAWLVNDPRVHFDPAHWAPVLAGTTSCVLGVRDGIDFPNPGRIALRVAADRPQGADLAALIACARLAVPLRPVPGPIDEQSRLAAFAAGGLDVVLLGGEGVPADAGVLEAAGGRLVCSFGQLDAAGRVVRDPLFADLPTVDELAAGAGDGASTLDAAWQAAASAARLDMMLVLPRLSDPGQIARWRAAGRMAVENPALAAAAAASAVTLATASQAEVIFASLGAAPLDPATLHAVLHEHAVWRPA